jgi:hypothetical protein
VWPVYVRQFIFIVLPIRISVADVVTFDLLDTVEAKERIRRGADQHDWPSG